MNSDTRSDTVRLAQSRGLDTLPLGHQRTVEIALVDQPVGLDTLLVDQAGAAAAAADPRDDVFSHLHFDRTTRTWWGHPHDHVQVETALPLGFDVADLVCL